MPKSKAHKVIGTATGLTVGAAYGRYCQRNRQNVWQFALGGALGGYATARLADRLEPSETLGPNHRGVFHGVTLNATAAGVAYDQGKIWLQSLVDRANEFDGSDQRSKAILCRLIAGFVIGALAGHASHLLADCTTPYGLPLLA